MNVVLIAEGSAGVQALTLLAASGHRVAAVFTTPAPAAPLRAATVATLAAERGIRVRPARQVKDAALGAELRAAGVDLILNVFSLHLVHPAVLAAARIGAFNLHPGPLPRYAGLNTPSWAIVRGERRHGVTLHWMEAGVDTGPVAYAAAVDIAPDDTGLSLTAKCVRAGLPLVSRLLQAAAADPRSVPAEAQDLAQRQRFGAGVPFGGRMRWSLDAATLADFVRACDFYPFPSPWGSPVSQLGAARVGIVTAARTHRPCGAEPGTLGAASDGAVAVATGDEWLLVRRARVGERTLRGEELAGLGARFSDPGAAGGAG